MQAGQQLADMEFTYLCHSAYRLLLQVIHQQQQVTAVCFGGVRRQAPLAGEVLQVLVNERLHDTAQPVGCEQRGRVRFNTSAM